MYSLKKPCKQMETVWEPSQKKKKHICTQLTSSTHTSLTSAPHRQTANMSL